MYQVLARKWRPQKFEEVIGQDHVVATLQNAIKSGKVGHAYLFSGPRGSGKTTMARLFAKALNCEKGPTPTPCDQCASCREVREGRSLDVIEVDAASRGRVEEMRELIEEARYAPSRDRHKIFIIDEVHMATTHAFNALLKTLEEPPPHIIFIMATTEKKKVIPTIVSRCQPFDFRKIAAEAVVAEIEKITAAEGVKISRGGIDTIVGFCDGSMRDALSTLDKLISFCGKEIQDDQIKTVLGFADREQIEEFIRGIAESDVEKVLRLTAKIHEQGQDVTIFFFELLSCFRDLLLVKSVEKVEEITFIPQEELRKLREFAQAFSREDLLRIFQILIDSEEKLKRSIYPRYIFEATSVKLASLSRLEPVENILRALRGGSDPDLAPDQPEETAGERLFIKSITPFTKVEEPAARLENPQEITEVIIEKLKNDKPFLNILLGNAHLKISAGILEISFTEISPIFQERLEDRDTISLIEKISSEVYGEKLRVRFLVPQKGKPAVEERPEAKEQAKRKVLFKEVSKEPIVQKFIEQFDATITEIKELKLMKEADDEKPR